MYGVAQLSILNSTESEMLLNPFYINLLFVFLPTLKVLFNVFYIRYQVILVCLKLFW